MMFIIRTEAGKVPELDVRASRRTPGLVAEGVGKIDYFCLGDPDTARAQGWTVVALHDGWYADDHGGGIAIWGQGLYWEVRDTPFTVKDAASSAGTPPTAADPSLVDVRRAIFGA